MRANKRWGNHGDGFLSGLVTNPLIEKGKSTIFPVCEEGKGEPRTFSSLKLHD